MIFTIPKLLLRTYIISFILWIIFTTVIPQVSLKYKDSRIKTNKFDTTTYPYSSITFPKSLPITNSLVYFIIGHPDDEVMFFAPSLIELSKSKYNNYIKLISLSKGDYLDDSWGSIRSNELVRSCEILGIDKSNITIENFRDGMNQNWSNVDLKSTLRKHIKDVENLVLITFDNQGVSKHPNHISLYHGTKLFVKSSKNKPTLYVLKSLNFAEKYSFTIFSNIEIFFDIISNFIQRFIPVNINISFFNKASIGKNVKIYSDLNMLSLSYAAMTYGHFSQMVWFRYGWLLLSRYLTFNHLIEETI
ncbi:unnamed protein product [Candida verbasci]|uniref:N-acetylglucosaminylphosphatidylinositol deacetylase n=1 Tax=Candida verbasci TaxID=1227364 RepID=A0A9W4X974_9ASCO|nr:unnamed protein product [Candida verbasci]